MPKINVYLPEALAESVKDLGIPVSAVCQHALEQAVRRVAAVRETARLDLETAPDGLGQFTDRARTAVRLGIEQAAAAGAERVGTEHLLAGLLAEGGNLALRVLRSLEIDLDELRRALPAAGAPGTSTGQLDASAAAALEQAAVESAALGHNYLGCEHLLLGLIAEPDGAGGRLLRSLGAEQRLTRRAVAAALSGYLHAQSRPAPAEPDPVLAAIVARLDRLEAQLVAVRDR